jgi:hypothetical protein
MSGTTFALEARLSVRDELTAALQRVSREARSVADVLERLKGISASAFTSATEAADKLTRAMGEVPAAGTRLGEAVVKGADVAVRGLSSATDAAGRLETALRKAGGAANGIRVPGAPTGGSGGSGGSGGGGGTPGGRPRGGGGSPMDAFALMAGGSMAAGFGRDVLGSIGDAFAAGSAYQHQQIMTRLLLGSSPTAGIDAAIANRAAWSTQQAVPGSRVTENLKAVTELYSVLGNMPEAAALLTPVQQYATVAKALVPGHNTDAYTALRAAEMLGWTVDPKTGAISASRANEFLGIAERAELATAGRVDERQLFNFAQMASLAAKNMTATGLLQMIPVINEMGGSRAGTALQSINQQINGGVMPQRVVADWQRLGLIDMNKVSPTRTGVRVGPGAITGGRLLSQNPVAFVEQVLLPAMNKAGYTPQTEVTEIMRLFSRSTSQREAGIIASQLVQINKDYQNELKATPTQAAVNSLTGNDLNTNLNALTASWNALMVSLSGPGVPLAVTALQDLAKTVNYLTAEATAHPEAARIILGVGGALGGLAVVGGSAAVALGGVRLALTSLAGLSFLANPIGLGVAAAVAAVGLAVSPKLRGLADQLQSGIFSAAHDAFKAAGVEIRGLAGTLGHEIIEALDHALAEVAPGLFGPHSTSTATTSPGRGLSVPAPSPKVQLMPAAPHPEAQHGADGHIKRGGYQPVELVIHNHVDLDGDKIATNTVRRMVDVARRPQTGRSQFDNRQAPLRPGMAIPLRI